MCTVCKASVVNSLLLHFVCLTRFFTDFCAVAKASSGDTCNGTYAVVYGVFCRQIGCTSAFSNLAGTEKVFIVL